MRESLRLYGRYVLVSLRSQMQYRGSFVMMTLGNFCITGIEFLAIWAMFKRFGSIGGWSLAEVALLYGIINTAFALAEGAGRGFDTFSSLVKRGDFDRLLLRPRSPAFQVAASELQLMRLGRLAQGLLVLFWATGRLGVAWTLEKGVLLVAAVLGGACLFVGLFVAGATLSFWSTESLELINIFTYGGTEAGQYPLSIYQPWYRGFFTFVVPLACVAFIPAQMIVGRQETGPWGWLGWISPLAGLIFLLLCLQIWKIGVKKYSSTGN